MSDGISIWDIATGLMIPVTVGAFGFLWKQIDKQRDKLGAAEERESAARKLLWEENRDLREQVAEWRVDAEKRYATKDHVSESQTEIKQMISKISDKLDNFLERILRSSTGAE